MRGLGHVHVLMPSLWRTTAIRVLAQPLSSTALKYLGYGGKYANNLQEITFAWKFVLSCFR